MDRRLKIKLIKQPPESDDCLRCCALMVFRYYKDNITKKEVWQKLHVYKKYSGLYGATFSDAARVALEIGYKATTLHYDWQWWNQDVVRASKHSKKELIDALKRLKLKKRKWAIRKKVEKTIDFVRMGGKYKFKYPRLENIDLFLKKNIPVILSVRAEELYQDPKEDYPHAILIIGKQGNNYLLNDPYLALSKISAEELYYSWVRNGGWMMAIYKP